ncbi:MAG TPA: phosphotransferase [Tepidiformaceae bacterium]|nr:phosphotransferase [Tepidiformaceae bacterium]
MTDPNTPLPDRHLERLGSGRAAEVFAWRPGLVIKLARDETFAAGLAFEADALAAAQGAGVRVPEPHGLTTFQGRAGLVMERIDGRDLFSIIEKQPWRVWRLASLTGRLHVELGQTAAPASAPGLTAMARAVISGSQHVPDAAAPQATGDSGRGG